MTPKTHLSIAYRGNDHPFRIKISPMSNMKVGFSGQEIFSSDVVDIDETSNRLDFTEKQAGAAMGEERVLSAEVDSGSYTRQGLAHAVEMAMERASEDKGTGVDYRVSWNESQETFSISEEDGPGPAKLDRMSVLFRTGENRKQSVGAFMGFSTDDIATEPSRDPLVSRRGVQWGVFNSLFDLRTALDQNDKEGLHQSISRLAQDHNRLLSNISQAGVRANRTGHQRQHPHGSHHQPRLQPIEAGGRRRGESDLRLTAQAVWLRIRSGVHVKGSKHQPAQLSEVAS